MGLTQYLPHFLARQFGPVQQSDFPGVLIPFEHAERHHSVVSRAEELKAEDEKTSSPSDSDPEKLGERRSSYSPYTIEGLRNEIVTDIAAFGHDSTYDRKAKVINKAIQDMGMGRYQWQLFILCGFGWFADNFWLQGIAVILTPLSKEFPVSSTHVRYTTFSLFVGLCLGASIWGMLSDVIGRRIAFNTTLFIGGVFGLSMGGANSWITVCALAACLGTGVGGNLPVDGALFLEFLPFASGNLLTLLSVWWPIGAMIASLIGWGLIPKYSCSADTSCSLTGGVQPCCVKDDNWGWRYFVMTLGCITLLQWALRFIFFQMFESPKFLLSKGRQAEAVAVIHGLAYKNKTKTWLTEDILNEIGGSQHIDDTKLTNKEIIKRSLSKFSTERIGPLFGSRKLGLSTALLWLEWFAIGMGYPLFNGFLVQYLKQAAGPNAPETPDSITYRNYAISTICGVPGSLLAYITVDIKYLGRKGTMAIGTLLTGIFVFLFTISADSDFQLAFTCVESFFQNIMYGVLYAYTPEVFPAPNRGTGTGISSFMNRVGGFLAPIVAIYASTSDPKSPIYASGALFLIAFISMLFLPIETRGKQTL